MHPISRPSVLCRTGQIDLNPGPHFHTPAIGPLPLGGGGGLRGEAGIAEGAGSGTA